MGIKLFGRKKESVPGFEIVIKYSIGKESFNLTLPSLNIDTLAKLSNEYKKVELGTYGSADKISVFVSPLNTNFDSEALEKKLKDYRDEIVDKISSIELVTVSFEMAGQTVGNKLYSKKMEEKDFYLMAHRGVDLLSNSLERQRKLSSDSRYGE